MSEASPFITKVLSHIDKLDKDELRRCISDLISTHQTYLGILEKVSSGILILNNDDDIIYGNKQAALWLGLDVDCGKKSIHDSLLDAVVSRWLSAVTESAGEELIEDLRVLNPREMVLRFRSFKLDSQAASKWLIVFDNVTADIRREEAKSRQSNQESLLRLASGVAHEVGNPLNAIQIHLELLKKEAEALNEKSKTSMSQKISVIQAETKRLDKIIRNFLKATRKPPLRFKHENLNVLIQGILHVLEPELQASGVEFSFKQDEDLPEFLMDKERIHEVFFNLIKNACESMPEGGSLKVSVSHKEKVVSVKIVDSGCGISEEDLPHIFDAYYTTKPEGSGLGLMTVYSAVAEHGGRIEVESKANKGTAFVVLLPIREPKKQLPDLTK